VETGSWFCEVSTTAPEIQIFKNNQVPSVYSEKVTDHGLHCTAPAPPTQLLGVPGVPMGVLEGGAKGPRDPLGYQPSVAISIARAVRARVRVRGRS
jgi:hypothetical protein